MTVGSGRSSPSLPPHKTASQKLFHCLFEVNALFWAKICVVDLHTHSKINSTFRCKQHTDTEGLGFPLQACLRVFHTGHILTMLRGYFWAYMSTSHKTGSDIRLWTPLNKSTDLCQIFYQLSLYTSKQTKTGCCKQGPIFFDLPEGKNLLHS